MSKRFISPAELAARWDIPLATIHTMAHRGLLPPRVRISTRTWRIELSELERWEEERRDDAVIYIDRKLS